MKTLVLLWSVLAVTALVGAPAAEKPAGPKLFLHITVERVNAAYLVVMLDGYAEEEKSGSLRFISDRAHTWAVLKPGGKCAAGDKFEVWAREDGMVDGKDVGWGRQPLRRYTVITAKRT